MMIIPISKSLIYLLRAKDDYSMYQRYNQNVAKGIMNIVDLRLLFPS